MTATLTNLVELFDITGKAALVVGATGALGRVAAIALGAAGARMTLASGNKTALEAVAQEVRNARGEVQTVNRRPETVDDAETMVSAATKAYGGLDLVVVASGMNKAAMITDCSVEDFQAIMDANVLGYWLVCRAAGKQFIEQGKGGKIVLASSTRGRLGHPGGYSPYCTSKSAVDGLVRALACEWGKYGITVNAIGPTVFRSTLTAWMFEDRDPGKSVREGMLARIPLGRLGEPEDLVGAILFLLSPAADFCTGQILYVDGGYTAG
ncbi:MAG: SDR family NAD(P)-dependent oxidoreductase [Dehalococcoidia bacterium]